MTINQRGGVSSCEALWQSSGRCTLIECVPKSKPVALAYTAVGMRLSFRLRRHDVHLTQLRVALPQGTLNQRQVQHRHSRERPAMTPMKIHGMAGSPNTPSTSSRVAASLEEKSSLVTPLCICTLKPPGSLNQPWTKARTHNVGKNSK